MIYALYGIPIFVWYIVKLGVLFKVLVMRSIKFVTGCCRCDKELFLCDLYFIIDGFLSCPIAGITLCPSS